MMFAKPMSVIGWFLGSWCLLVPESAAAQTFTPKVAAVCIPKDGRLVLDQARMIGQLEKAQGISQIDLDENGGTVSLADRKEALLDPERFCTEVGKCSKGTKEKLGSAKIILSATLSGSPANPGQTRFRPATRDARPIATAFLRGQLTILCTPDPIEPKPDAPKQDDAPPQFFAIRKRVEDLAIAPGPAVAKLDRASITASSDFQQNTSAFGVDVALGYTYGGTQFTPDIFGTLTPFISYNQNYVDRSVGVDTQIYNLGLGVLGDIIVTRDDFAHHWRFYPKYTNSLGVGTQIISGTFSYAPEPWAPFIAPSPISPSFDLELTPEVRATYQYVFDDGGNPLLIPKGNYLQLGPRLAAVLYGTTEELAGFTINASYEYYWLDAAPIDELWRFEVSLNYAPKPEANWSFQIKYVDGNDLDTWQRQQQISAGVGVRY